MNPRREPLGIHFGYEGEPVPLGTRLFVNRGPRGTPEERQHHTEAGILRGQVEMSGADNTPEAVAARWRAAGLALPDSPDYVPDVFDRYFEVMPREGEHSEN